MNKYTLEVKYFGITLGLLLTAWLFEYYTPLDQIRIPLDSILYSLNWVSLVSIFLMALVANCSIMVQIPYTLPILSIALQGTPLEHMLMIGLAAGIGGGLGKLIAYRLAYRFLDYASHLKENNLFRWIAQQAPNRPRITLAMAFIVISTPIPDETAVIPMAAINYRIKQLITPFIIGKLIHNLTTVTVFYFLSKFSADQLVQEFKAGLALATIIALVMFVLYQIEKTRQLQYRYS